MTEQERLAAGLRYLEQQKKADPLESFRSLEGLKGAYERRVQPIINNAMQTFETGGAIGDLLRAYGSAAAPANAAVLEGMGMPYRGPITAPRQEGVSSGENFRAMGDPRQQAVGQMIGDPANLAQPVGARLANALKFAKPDAMKMVQEMSRGAISPMDVWHGSPHRFAPTAKNPLGEFDPTKIGTGEGAQVYGYGHYLAEAKDIGKSYRETLAHKGALDLEYEANKRGIPLSRDARIEFMRQAASDVPAEKTVKNLQNANIEARKLDQTKLAELVKDYKESKQGSLYKVDLPDEVVPRMLDYDKPINEQSPYVIEALRRAGINEMSSALAGPMAQGQEAHLAKFGIPGIKYLDEASRKKGTGTRNYVVFPGNEGLLNILGRE